MAPPDLADFAIESATFEFRYGDALDLWDHSGKLWKEISALVPDLKLKTAEPKVVRFGLGDAIDLGVEFTKAYVMQQSPDKDLKRLTDLSTVIADACARTLHIADFTRVALRLVYWKETQTAEEAAQFVIGSGLFRLPQRVPVARDAVLTQPEFSGRWESKTLGAYIAIRAQTRSITIEVPPNLASYVELKRNKSELYGVVQDVDIYTKGASNAEQIRPVLWIENAFSTAKKALAAVVEG